MARRILRLLGTRYGIAAVLLVVVLAVVGIARAVSGPSTVDNGRAFPPAPAEPVAPSSAVAGTAASELGDDSVATPESPPPPSLVPGAPAPETVALDFAKAWVRKPGVTTAQWRKGLESLATPRLLGLLKDTDVASVPADAVRGPVQARNRDALLVEYTIPVNPGLLQLTVVLTNGRWLVDRLGWDRP